MIDKLILKSNEFVKRDIIISYFMKNSLRWHISLDRNYREVFVSYRNEKSHMTIKTKPSLSNTSKLMLIVNPNHFSDINDLVLAISDLFCLEKLRIHRIDFCVDLQLPLYEVMKKLICKRKKRRSDYRESDKLTGVEIGSSSEVIVVYDKAFERQRARKYKKIIDVSEGERTRIEVRHTGKKIEYKELVDLEKYAQFNPFRCIHFLDVVDSNSSRSNELKSFLESGVILHRLYKELNANNNFNMTYNKHFRSSDLNQTIYYSYKDNLQKFFMLK